MRENRPYGSEGGGSRATGPPYPYCGAIASRLRNKVIPLTRWRFRRLCARLRSKPESLALTVPSPRGHQGACSGFSPARLGSSIRDWWNPRVAPR